MTTREEHIEQIRREQQRYLAEIEPGHAKINGHAVADEPPWPSGPEDYGPGDVIVGEPAPTEQPRTPWRVPSMIWRPTASIPPREFLYGRHYARDFVSVTIGDGGIGKSALRIAEIIVLASGKPLLDVTPAERVRCLYWNGDDPLVEIERRIHATGQHFGIDVESLIKEGWLYIGTSDQQPLMVGDMHHGSIRINPHALGDICGMIEESGIGFAAFDPFKSLHRLPENNATEIDAIADVFSKAAARTHTAISLDHHIRKPAHGQGEATSADGRGANAMINKARLSRVLNPMTPTLAEQARIPEDQRGFYFRADSGKRNIAPPQQATWYHLVNVVLANGDEIGVPVSWKFPGAFDDITPDHMHRVRTMAAEGAYRKDSRAGNWIGIAVAEVVGLDLDDEADRKQVRNILKTWFANRVLKVENREDEHRHSKPFVAPGNWKEEREAE
jgi:hypothetical protein